MKKCLRCGEEMVKLNEIKEIGKVIGYTQICKRCLKND